jgi:hypothetical protein
MVQIDRRDIQTVADSLLKDILDENTFTRR